MTEIRISRKALIFWWVKTDAAIKSWLVQHTAHSIAHSARIRIPKHKYAAGEKWKQSQFEFNCQMKIAWCSQITASARKILSIQFYYYYSLNRRLLLSITRSTRKLLYFIALRAIQIRREWESEREIEKGRERQIERERAKVQWLLRVHAIRRRVTDTAYAAHAPRPKNKNKRQRTIRTQC